jgi:small subunit ribosomal protein S21
VQDIGNIQNQHDSPPQAFAAHPAREAHHIEFSRLNTDRTPPSIEARPSVSPAASLSNQQEVSMSIRVKARSGESVEGLMRRFKKLCEKEGLTKDVKRKEFYEKPSERMRRDARKSVSRRMKEDGTFIPKGPMKGGKGAKGAKAGAGKGPGGGGGGMGYGGGRD